MIDKLMMNMTETAVTHNVNEERLPSRETPTKRINIVLGCVLAGDLSRLQECFTNCEDPYFERVEGQLNSVDQEGRTPIEVSCIRGDADMVRFLLEKGSDPNVRNQQSGKPALDIACILGRESIVKELLERGADVDAVSQRGYTALHHAAAWGKIQCLKILVEFGALLSVITTHGEKARDIAVRYQHDDCAYYLDWSEAKQGLLSVIRKMKETVEDPQKLQGRLTKDEKMSAINLCSEKQEWLESADNVSIEALIKNQQLLIEALEPIQQKLLEPAPEKPHRR